MFCWRNRVYTSFNKNVGGYMKRKESISIRFLYHTHIGRLILKGLVRPRFSKMIFYFLDSRFSKCMIPYYIKKYNIDMSAFQSSKFVSFNDFFKRKREILLDTDEESIISPCDGLLSVYKIDSNCVLNVKNTKYTIESILKNESLAKKYEDGLCLVFRLEPHHYHRYLFIDHGVMQHQSRINGVLHCVKPIACDQFPVYVQNSREYAVIKTEHVGTMIQMEVGALMVGRIRNNLNSMQVKKGQEKGYFEFGGSTIIVMFEKDKISLNEEFLSSCNTGEEIPVKIGSVIGKAKENERETI